MSRELLLRIATAVIAVPLLLLAAAAETPIWFDALAFAAVLLAVHELFVIAKIAKAPPFRAVGFLGAAGLLAAAAAGRLDLQPLVIAAMTVALLVAMLTRVADKSRVLVSAGVTAFAVLYVALLGSYIVAIRALPNTGGIGWRPGLAGKLLWLFFVTIMANDIGAYFTGRAIGRHKLAPRVSPGKSVEGAVGGLVAGTLAAVAAHYTFFPDLPVRDAAALGVVMGVLGPVGDLCESLVKRGSNVKDAASILPGHGGFLDRLDSMLLNAPVLYYYYLYVLAPRLGH